MLFEDPSLVVVPITQRELYKQLKQEFGIKRLKDNAEMLRVISDINEANACIEITMFWVNVLRFCIDKKEDVGIWFWEGHPSKDNLIHLLREGGFMILDETSINKNSNLNTVLICKRV